MSREQDIVGEALEFDDPRERNGFVLGACGGDQALLKRIEKLLAAFSQADGQDFLPDRSIDAFAPIREGEGSIIGRYKLLQKIGEGGFGVVYMGDQLEPVKRRIALKIIKLGMDTKQVVARFEAERQALALMDHPNIAKVLDAGATESGRPYFVMELVRGVPLLQFCDEQKLTTEARIELFLDICGAIEHAHQKGIIHRDLKPSNVIVTLHNDRPVPKVIDFGIAKAAQQELTDKTLFTRYEDFVGTPAYMSPEQATYSGLDIDTRSDVYSLGVMLYELFIGRPPFDTRELLGSGIDELRRRIREEEPARPSTCVNAMEFDALTRVASARGIEPSRFGKLLRGELDWIVMRAMEKERERRYQSVSALRSDLLRYLGGETVQACPPSSLYRLKKFSRRHRLALGVATSIAAALAVGIAASLWQAARASRAERDASARMWESLVHQARLNRGTGKPGQRFQTLEIIRTAAAIRPSLDLRNEAIAAMVLPDIRQIAPLVRAEPELIGARGWTKERQAVAVEDGRVREYTREGTLIRELPHNGSVSYVAYSPDAQFLVTAYNDRTTKHRTTALWRDDRETTPFLVVEDLNCVGFSPDGKRLAVAFRDDKVGVYNLENGSPLAKLPVPFSPTHLEFSPEGDRLALSTRFSKEVIVIDAQSGERLISFDHSIIHGSLGAWGVAWDETGKLLATTTGDFVAHLWEANTGQYIRSLRGHEAEVPFTDFMSGTPYLFTSSWDTSTRVWNYHNGSVLIEGPAYTDIDSATGHFEVSPKQAEAGSWVFEKGAEWFSEFHLDGNTSDKRVAIAFSPDSEWVAASASQELTVWNLRTKAVIASRADHGGPSINLMFEPGGTTLLLSDEKGLRRFPLVAEVDEAGRKGVGFGTPKVLSTEERTGFDMSHDGKRIARFAKHDGAEIVVSDLASSKTLADLKARGGMERVRFSPDGRWLTAGAWQGRGVMVWDLENPELEPRSFLDSDSVTRAHFSADSRSLYASSRTGGLRVWKTGTWEPDGTIGEAGPQTIIAVDPTGHHILTRLTSGELHLIDARTRSTVAILRTPTDSLIDDGIFSPDGEYVAACSQQRGIYVWHIPAMRADLREMGLDWE